MHSLAIDQVTLTLKEIIVNDLDTNMQMEDIAEDQSLYEDGIGLDSISIVNFIILVEDRFNINFEQEHINTAMFSNLHNLATHISARMEAQPR
jgi:acyl carrier protein